MTVRNGTVLVETEPCQCGWKPPKMYRAVLLTEEGRPALVVDPDVYLLELWCPCCNAGFTVLSATSRFDPATTTLQEEKELDDVSLN